MVIIFWGDFSLIGESLLLIFFLWLARCKIVHKPFYYFIFTDEYLIPQNSSLSCITQNMKEVDGLCIISS